MKAKSMWIAISVLSILGLLICSFGCAPTAQPEEVIPPGYYQLPEKISPDLKGAWDSRGYWPQPVAGKNVDIIQLLAAHPVELNFKQGWLDENEVWNLNLNFYDANVDMAVMNELVDASISRKADLILLSVLDPASGVGPIERAQAAGIPVITYENQTSMHGDLAIMQDQYGQGQVAGELLAEAIGDSGKVAIVMGDLVTCSGLARVKGCEDVMAGYPDIEVVTVGDCRTGPWVRAGAHDSTKGVLTAYPDVDGIFAGDDEMAQGVIVAVEEAGKAGQIQIVGVGGERSGLTAIKEGRMYGTAMYNFYEMGRMMIRAAVFIISSPGYVPGTLQGIYWQENVPVTIDNVDEVQWPPVG